MVFTIMYIAPEGMIGFIPGKPDSSWCASWALSCYRSYESIR
jgi:hypothetical protein